MRFNNASRSAQLSIGILFASERWIGKVPFVLEQVSFSRQRQDLGKLVRVPDWSVYKNHGTLTNGNLANDYDTIAGRRCISFEALVCK